MTEMINRAARRAAGKGKDEGRIRISTRIDVVPMEHVESYLGYEILSEGNWRNGVKLIILRPPVDRGLADSRWIARLLARMQEARQRHGLNPITINPGSPQALSVDVGLVDVTVFFELSRSRHGVRPKSPDESERLLAENLRHLDKVCDGAFHDQMILAIAVHGRHSNGSYLFHYHNLIFGLRQEVRGDMDILGLLDLEPLLNALSKAGSLNIIGGIKPQPGSTIH